MVEFAIVLPLLLLLIYGIISFGAQFLVLQTLKQAASDGARAAVAGTTQSSEVSQATSTVLSDLSYLPAINASDVSVTFPASCSASAPATSGGCINVAVSYPYATNPLVPAFPGIPTLGMNASTTVLANPPATTTTVTS